MSNVECRKNKIPTLIFIFLVVFLGTVFFIVGEKGNFKKADGGAFSDELCAGEEYILSLEVKKGDIITAFRNKGMKIPIFFSLLPDKTKLSAKVHIRVENEGGKDTASLVSVSFNGIEIPTEILSDMKEMKLDFKRLLVYN